MIVVGLNIICTFVKSNHFRRDSKINIYDKGLPTVISSESAVTPFLKWFDTPNGNPAYKFFKMSNKKNFVTASQRAKVALTPEQQENRKELNNLICRYVEFCLRYSAYFQKPVKPVSKKYMAIYMQSLNPAVL